mmetsp:Transcript_71647/g.114041  ORF Transcript_71647/g.114041 Transcript_71647/m.114041 type:complete len:223 (-) Transcript_71647:650-1318(-)
MFAADGLHKADGIVLIEEIFTFDKDASAAATAIKHVLSFAAIGVDSAVLVQNDLIFARDANDASSGSTTRAIATASARAKVYRRQSGIAIDIAANSIDILSVRVLRETAAIFAKRAVSTTSSTRRVSFGAAAASSFAITASIAFSAFMSQTGHIEFSMRVYFQFIAHLQQQITLRGAVDCEHTIFLHDDLIEIVLDTRLQLDSLSRLDEQLCNGCNAAIGSR